MVHFGIGTRALEIGLEDFVCAGGVCGSFYRAVGELRTACRGEVKLTQSHFRRGAELNRARRMRAGRTSQSINRAERRRPGQLPGLVF